VCVEERLWLYSSRWRESVGCKDSTRGSGRVSWCGDDGAKRGSYGFKWTRNGGEGRKAWCDA